MSVEVITKKELEEFKQLWKKEVIDEIFQLLKKSGDIPQGYLKGSEVRKILGGMAASTLNYHRKNGKIKAKKIGRTYYYDKDSLMSIS